MPFLLQLQEQGQQPQALLTRPTRKPQFYWLFEAYDLLTRSRQIGMTEYFIPMSEYYSYAQLVDMQDVEQRLFMVSVISQVDAVVLSEKLKAAKK